ncbi:MAG: NAD(P)H-hydrate dehydratase [Oscillospiraceae bacterium]|nr:NAD(P)H-hydrate dehydratase [Oscillospiraceae bacterium]
MRILTCEQMREVEKAAVGEGLSYLQLMENAGTAAFNCILQRERSLVDKKCIVLCGSGNNGGDGYVAARKLVLAGALVYCVMVGGPPRSAEATEMYNLFINSEGEVGLADEDRAELNRRMLKSDIVVDAIFGTGFKGALPEKLNFIVEMCNLSEATTYSIDIPSGMDGDTGGVSAKCIRADVTIALEALKPAHLSTNDTDYIGEVQLVRIGIKEDAYRGVNCKTFYIDDYMAYVSLKKRPKNSNKGAFGKLLCVCGSVGMTGAAVLSTQSAMKSGTGLVYLASPLSVIPVLASHLVEQIFLPMPENKYGSLSREALPKLLESLESMTAALVGCGMRSNPDTAFIMRELLEKSKCPLIIDADGINAIASDIDMLHKHKQDLVLTPHLGEMSRLIGQPVDYINSNRAKIAAEFAVKNRLTLVLKGSNTIVAAPNGEIFINSTGNPGLAKAGSGDLLAGMAASFVAQGLNPVHAAMSAVYLHGLAADYTAKRLSQYSMTASDVLDDYYEVFKECDL